MELQQNVNLRPKNTMRIGGNARYYALLASKNDVEQAVQMAAEKHYPLIMLGSGSNTVFADGVINALVVQLKHDTVSIDSNIVTVGCGKNLAMLINELGARDLDLSALTGIPGTVGGALFGNAGQGPKGVWIDSFVVDVTAFIDGKWTTLTKDECKFRYRESLFKDFANHYPQPANRSRPPILWECRLTVPSRPAFEIRANVETLLKKRIETQPHLKTAGSCFKAAGDTPAWQLIDAAGLRGYKYGDVQIAEKHANFLLNVGQATYDEAKALIAEVQSKIPDHLEVEMRFIEPDGSLAY